MRFAIVATTFLALALAPPAGAMNVADYMGYAWEGGGFPTSLPGDVLEGTGIVDWIDPVAGVDLATTEVTFHISGLASTGEFVDGSGNTIVSYTGGTLELFADPTPDADWGTLPPNATSPASFVDGDLLFRGAFTSFTLFVDSNGSGAYEGNLDGLAGSLLGGPCTGCSYTWGGAFATGSGAAVPAGYDLQLDGQLDVDPAVGTQDSSWGAVKALFSSEEVAP